MSIIICCSIGRKIPVRIGEYANFSHLIPLLQSALPRAIISLEGFSFPKILLRVIILIYTKRKYLTRCLGQSSSLDAAIDHLLHTDLRQLSKGRNEIDGDQAFVNRFDYQTMPAEQAIWEGHAKYGDIHVLLSGHEKIGVTNTAQLKMMVQKPDEDFIGYEGDVQVWLPMTPEDVLIVYPEDAHMVKVIDTQSTLVEKACYKFKV